MLIKAAINGRRTASEHPKVPINPGQQAHQAALAVSAGARAIHVQAAHDELIFYATCTQQLIYGMAVSCPRKAR
jgi:beta-keto acid cleavage enzyme